MNINEALHPKNDVVNSTGVHGRAVGLLKPRCAPCLISMKWSLIKHEKHDAILLPQAETPGEGHHLPEGKIV